MNRTLSILLMLAAFCSAWTQGDLNHTSSSHQVVISLGDQPSSGPLEDWSPESELDEQENDEATEQYWVPQAETNKVTTSWSDRLLDATGRLPLYLITRCLRT